MIVKFYKCSQGEEHANKVLTNEKSFNDCKLIQPTNILHPIIKLSHNADNVFYNYCYIPDFGRYYFMKLDSIENGIDYFRCDVDTLKSWYSDIANSNATITRCVTGDDYIVDNLAIQKDAVSVVSTHLGNAFTSGNTYVLIKGCINYIND